MEEHIFTHLLGAFDQSGGFDQSGVYMMVSPTETFRRVQPYGDQGPERCWLRKQLLGLSTSLAKCQMAASGKKPPQKNVPLQICLATKSFHLIHDSMTNSVVKLVGGAPPVIIQLPSFLAVDPVPRTARTASGCSLSPARSAWLCRQGGGWDCRAVRGLDMERRM